jgi:hypothetical protein
VFCLSCTQTNKESENKSDGKIFYIETESFGNDLNSCFGNTIFNKWSTLDFQLNDPSKTYSGKDPNEIHIFSDIGDFKETVNERDFEKIVIRLKGDWTVQNTKYSIERFKYDGNGAWRRIGNLGDFKTFDRANDFISPGNLDVDELCEQMVNMTIKASYK